MLLLTVFVTLLSFFVFFIFHYCSVFGNICAVNYVYYFTKLFIMLFLLLLLRLMIDDGGNYENVTFTW